MATEPKLGPDVFRALAAIGWADGKLQPDEADAIVRAALEEGLELEEIEAIEKATKEPVEVGSIDISNMTKADRLFVYAVGTWIARVDGRVAEPEAKALDELARALKIPERPRERVQEIVVEIGKLGDSEEAVFFNLPKLRRTLKVRLAEAQALRANQKDEDED
jgi:uncharacterized membrane protein YebE (DUF533 family)